MATAPMPMVPTYATAVCGALQQHNGHTLTHGHALGLQHTGKLLRLCVRRRR